MIKIYYLQGCYGNYLAQCIYFFTDLSQSRKGTFCIDEKGSSHNFPFNAHAKQFIMVGHDLQSLSLNKNDKTVLIADNSSHWLDYMNNDFYKNFDLDLVQFVTTVFSTQHIEHKLKQGWNYDGSFQQVPIWIWREFLSFYVSKYLENLSKENSLEPNLVDCVFYASNFFENYVACFKTLCHNLGLRCIEPDTVIQSYHQDFLSKQKYHGSQINCEKWVHAVIDKFDTANPAQTIFDEAYIQHCFRTLGYGVLCHNLNLFPQSSLDMANQIYPL